MLTDIFADRYLSIPMWDSFGEADRRFIVQGFRMVREQLYPYWVDGKYRGIVSKLDCFHAISDQITEDDLSKFFFVA